MALGLGLAGTTGSVNAHQLPRSGAAVYNFSCINCHESGVAGAPKTGDHSAWDVRLAQGNTSLVDHVYQGYKSMPQRGTCTQCSREEVANAVAFMLSRLHPVRADTK